jgi:hypothetical protein
MHALPQTHDSQGKAHVPARLAPGLGGLGADVLVGRETAFDANLAALTALMAEWTRDDAYRSRLDRPQGSAFDGLNVGHFLDEHTLRHDPSRDTLTGGAGQDWFLALTPDLLKDWSDDEQRRPA